MEHTKGEWKLKRNALGTWTIQTDLEPIGQIDRHFNAHLISASPDLYEALRHTVISLVNRLDDTDNLTQQEELLLIEARQAIAKAEGKS